MWTLLVLCAVTCSLAGPGADAFYTTWSPQKTTGSRSCRYNCGYNLGSCSCSSSCRNNGTCCHDYSYYCNNPTTTTPRPPTTMVTGSRSCRYNCGYNLGSCSCSSSCRYNGNCCHDYSYYCSYPTTTTPRPPTTMVTGSRSCRYNCGYNLGSCSCSSSCRYNGNCCHDYSYYCPYPTTTTPRPPTTMVTGSRSCRYNCGYNLGSCSCSSSCRYNGNCCHDYQYYCPSTTTPHGTTYQRSCRYNCGYNLGSCSCASNCRYYGNCCHDYSYYCPSTTTAQPSCRYNCGSWMGSCSCSSSCRYNGNCCYDYYSQCSSYTTQQPTTAQPSCRYNCGSWMGSCSCSSSCQYNGNCCPDYYYQCSPYTTQTVGPTAQPSCRYNCGSWMGSCSCSSSCQYNGNCCYDYYSQCYYTTTPPNPGPCGGYLFGTGTISSPNHPNYYHDNAHCSWQLRASHDHKVFLKFTFLQLENCCGCDYIYIYDGPSVYSPYLGKVCHDSNTNDTLPYFNSTSNYMTVLFRTDSSVVGRGFTADFMSTLPLSSGRLRCFDDTMTIVIEKTYLNSLGYDGHNLYLNDPQCRPSVYSSQVVFSFPINTCGNIKKVDNGRVVYSNTLRAYTSSYGEITRQDHFKLNLDCRMDDDSVAQIMYLVNHRSNSSIVGTGKLGTKMDFYTSSSFYYKVTESPYLVSLNQRLYVQVDLTNYDSSLVVFLDTCVTSPSAHFQNRTYYLVRNGCPVDSTYASYISGTRPYARFTFKAFQFLRATESVYIQCKVLVCQASDYNSRCRRGCYKRKARDLGSEHDSHTLVLGPIQLKDPEKKEEGAQKQAEA